MAQFSDAQIRAYVEANIDNPAAIAAAAASAGVSMADLSRATGFSVADIGGYFGNAGVEPPAVVSAPAYFNANKDVANAYQDNSYGMTPQEFADFHYTNYGANEGRATSSVSVAEPAPSRYNVSSAAVQAQVAAEQQAENQRQAEAQARAQAEAQARAQAEAQARAQAEAQRASELAAAKAAADAAKAQADAAAKAQADAAAKAGALSQAKTYTQAEVNQALADTLKNDPNASKADVIKAAAGFGVTAEQVNAAYSSLPPAKTSAEEAWAKQQEENARLWAAQQAEQLTKTGIDQALWRASGRATKANPNKEDGDWWNENGSMMVDQWIKWRNGVNGWTMWQHNGIPAVELALNPIWHDVPVQMHLDRVMVNPDGELVVLDIKTGARTPSSDLQLAFYAAGMEEILGVRPKWGAYWMGRTGITTEMVDLDLFPKEYIMEIVSKFDRARKDGIFIPNFSHCVMCQLKDKCKYKTGGK